MGMLRGCTHTALGPCVQPPSPVGQGTPMGHGTPAASGVSCFAPAMEQQAAPQVEIKELPPQETFFFFLLPCLLRMLIGSYSG